MVLRLGIPVGSNNTIGNRIRDTLPKNIAKPFALTEVLFFIEKVSNFYQRNWSSSYKLHNTAMIKNWSVENPSINYFNYS